MRIGLQIQMREKPIACVHSWWGSNNLEITQAKQIAKSTMDLEFIALELAGNEVG